MLQRNWSLSSSFNRRARTKGTMETLTLQARKWGSSKFEVPFHGTCMILTSLLRPTFKDVLLHHMLAKLMSHEKYGQRSNVIPHQRLRGIISCLSASHGQSLQVSFPTAQTGLISLQSQHGVVFPLPGMNH